MAKKLANIEQMQIRQRLNSDLYYEFIQFIDVKQTTAETYKKGIKQFFFYLLEHDIQEPTRADVIGFKEEMKETRKASTAQTYLASVKAFFRWAEAQGYYQDIAKHVKNIKIEQDFKKDYLTSEQAKSVLKAVNTNSLKGLRDYAIMSLMITTGLRTIEVSRINLEDMKTLGNGTVIYVQGKGKDTKNDYVLVSVQVEEAIRAYLKAVGIRDSKEPMFISLDNRTKGNRLTARSVSRICKNRMVQVGLDSDRLTAHSFRHTAVTLALLNGNDLMQVQQMARHANINTTMIYNHALEKASNPCTSSISSLLFE